MDTHAGPGAGPVQGLCWPGVGLVQGLVQGLCRPGAWQACNGCVLPTFSRLPGRCSRCLLSGSKP